MIKRLVSLLDTLWRIQHKKAQSSYSQCNADCDSLMPKGCFYETAGFCVVTLDREHPESLITEYEQVMKQTDGPLWKHTALLADGTLLPKSGFCNSDGFVFSGDSPSVTLACIAWQNTWLCSELLITFPDRSTQTGHPKDTNKERCSRQHGDPSPPTQKCTVTPRISLAASMQS